MLPRQKKDTNLSAVKKIYKQTMKEKFPDEIKFIENVDYKIEEDDHQDVSVVISIYVKKDSDLKADKMTEISNALTLALLKRRTRQNKSLPWPYIDFFSSDD